jgi:Protein of unknown function (DUF2934)
MVIDTPRTRLRCWEQIDRDAFAAMHADPEVMHDYGGPISRRESDAKLDRYAEAYHQHGLCRWAVEGQEGPLSCTILSLPLRSNRAAMVGRRPVCPYPPSSSRRERARWLTLRQPPRHSAPAICGWSPNAAAWQIRERAYYLWQEAGCPDNHADGFWQRAYEIQGESAA